MQDRLKDIINTVLKNRGKQQIQILNSETHLRDGIGFDSLDLAELTVRIEAEYGVDIFEKRIVNTVGEMLEAIENEESIS